MREDIWMVAAGQWLAIPIFADIWCPHMSGRNIWINFEAPQQYIGHINPWKKCSNLVQLFKYLVEPFLRPFKSKDVQCWILPEFWGYDLEICMTNGSKVLIYLTLRYFFFALLTIVSLWETIKKTNKSEL
jgi:hypothetical protein